MSKCNNIVLVRKQFCYLSTCMIYLIDVFSIWTVVQNNINIPIQYTIENDKMVLKHQNKWFFFVVMYYSRHTN